MRNRLERLRSDDAASRTGGGESTFRLGVIYGVIVLLLTAVAVRAIWLQTAGRAEFLAIWDREYERLEPIPARNGRILTADGLVLAADETEFAVAVHYRWFEEPPNAGWLRSQMLARLPPASRRDREQVAEARRKVLLTRERMHRELAAVLGTPMEELQQRFARIQTRIERIAAAVEARRQSTASELTPESFEPAAAEGHDPAPHPDGWRGLAGRVWRELTTPPQRPAREPVVVAEELQYHVIEASAAREAAGRIESFPARFPGVEVRLATRRAYPGGDLASHLVGARTPLREEELASRNERLPQGDPLGYRQGDPVGRSGLELSYDAVLHGVPGLRRVVSNRQGETLREEVVRPPVNGRDVTLAIDSRLQRTAERLLDEVLEFGAVPRSDLAGGLPDGAPGASPRPVGGCLVAMDVRTGRVLTAAAAPRHDARLLVAAAEEEWRAVASDPRNPFFPRISEATLPPGSVFKILTAVAGLETGCLDPDERLECRGYLQTPDRDRCAIYRHFGVGHGPVALDEALSQSCNVYFYELGQRVGAARLADWAGRFGLGTPTGSDLPAERSGLVPTPEWASGRGERWYPGLTRQLAVGQGALTVTPLQAARMMAAIANDGWLLTPQFVREHTAGSNGPVLDSDAAIQLVSHQTGLPTPTPAAVRSRVPHLSPATLARIRQALALTVAGERGTGREARVPGLTIAGKTGTAETGGGRPDHAWFAGFAPLDAPRIAFVVVLEHGGGGGRAAAPIAREFLIEAIRLGHLHSSDAATVTAELAP